ncbi:MAG: tetratricopeptide repeat protein [Elusimicrobiota bacterium]
MITKQYFPITTERSYRPVATLSYFINFLLWDGHLRWHRVINPVLHLMVSFMVFLVIQQLYSSQLLAVLTALFFAAHPVHSEIMYVVTHNENLLLGLFFLLAFYLYIIDGKDNKVTVKRIISVLSYLLALFSKETALMFIPLLIVHDWLFYPGKKVRESVKQIFARYIWVTILYLVVRFWLMAPPYSASYIGDNVISNTLSICFVIVKYIKLLILPTNLSVLINIPVITSVFAWQFLAGICVLTLILILIYYFYMKNRRLSFMLIWPVFTLLPALNIVFAVVTHPMGERYLYLSVVGYCFIIAYVFIRALKNRIVLIAATGIVIIFYASIILARSDDWRTEKAFFTKTVQQSPWSGKAQNNLGIYYLKSGEWGLAEECFVKAIELSPEEWQAYSNLSIVYLKTKQFVKRLNILLLIREKMNGRIIPDLEYEIVSTYKELGKEDECINILQRLRSISNE